jgi:hypothetical protein
MASDTPLKKENPGMANPDQPKMPKYEYQPNDSRSFSVGFETRGHNRAKMHPR